MENDNICVICGEPKGRNKYCCSMACFAEYKQTWKTCIVCGKQFKDPACNLTKCCSRECSGIHRKQMAANGVFDKNLKRMLETRVDFDKEHKGENHINAKQWVIESPTGERYQCTNLMHFIRENADMFDGTVKQVFDGFQKIKASALGKRKYKSYTYKGWKLLRWSEESINQVKYRESKNTSQ